MWFKIKLKFLLKNQKYASSIEKGDYIVKLHVRHESIELLEKLKDLSLYVRHTLTGTLNQDIYLNHIGLVKGSGKKSGNERILINNESVYYLNTIPDDKLPKGIANGHFLTGHISFFKDPKKSQVVRSENNKKMFKTNYCMNLIFKRTNIKYFIT